MKNHNRCGCPESRKGFDCPACRGTGLIPPVSAAEYADMLAVIEAAKELQAIKDCEDQQSWDTATLRRNRINAAFDANKTALAALEQETPK